MSPEIPPRLELDVRMTVKGYLALLVGVFVAALLAVTLVQRDLVGDLGGAVRDITRSHQPKASAARELRAAHLAERRALAGFLLTAEPLPVTASIGVASGVDDGWRGWSARPTPACTPPRRAAATGW
jgi:hypothetical protein